MRHVTSICLTILATGLLAQRLNFEDPELTFSIKKPKDWILIDDGYVVKFSPTKKDTANIYITFTYFEAPSAINYEVEMDTDVPVVIPFGQSDEYGVIPNDGNKIKIAGEEGSWSETNVESNGTIFTRRIYHFTQYGQRWDIVTNAPESEMKKYQRYFKKVIKSLRTES